MNFVCWTVIAGFLVVKTDSTCLNHTSGLPDQKGGSLTAVALTVAAAGRRFWSAVASAWMSVASNGIVFLECRGHQFSGSKNVRAKK